MCFNDKDMCSKQSPLPICAKTFAKQELEMLYFVQKNQKVMKNFRLLWQIQLLFRSAAQAVEKIATI